MPRRTEPSPFSSKVGARIRELRLERNMSLPALGEASSISKGHLSNIEHGFAAITIETVDRIARALDIPPLYILAFPTEDERARIADAVRKLPKAEWKKLRKEIEGRAPAAPKKRA
ncbi:helix-turn-helix domain-containing protein [Polyangium jinanense]|uniref:Helix-turn-helix transcriptional regulator n=1 Tax=Polyangium jinanense TaxID=2829994 RepID=A0A9X3XA79_9BACT|nr:helix-turn-helix transcriptional regulator [Polyangium jinanense]MDC3960631.1 helix-turn-helix transcriptional regulator [Polyangium jinanense]MDC3986919.1 helix-turn-helix transcriptional regulator [Polyangium jinanense]